MRAPVCKGPLFKRLRFLEIASATLLIALASGCTLATHETSEQAQRNQYFLSNRAGAP